MKSLAGFLLGSRTAFSLGSPPNSRAAVLTSLSSSQPPHPHFLHGERGDKTPTGFNELPAPVSTFAYHAFLLFHPVQVSCTRVSAFPVSDGRSCLLQGVLIGVSPSGDLKAELRDLPERAARLQPRLLVLGRKGQRQPPGRSWASGVGREGSHICDVFCQIPGAPSVSISLQCRSAAGSPPG